jgi:hypothetical protein
VNRTTASSLAPSTPSLVLDELGSYHFQFWGQQARGGRFLACHISRDSDNVGSATVACVNENVNLTCSVSSLTNAWTRYLCPSLGVSDPKYPSVTRSDTMRVGWTSLWNRQMNEKPPLFLLRVRSSICRWYSEVVYILTPFSSCLREKNKWVAKCQYEAEGT